MLSLTSEYALRAMIFLAQHEEDWPLRGHDIAHKTGVPPKYLSKILGDLVRAGVLESSRGIGGGFRMAKSAKATRLLDVLAPFELFEGRRCPFGNQQCGDDNPCLAHDQWKKVVEAQQGFLRKTSVLDVAVSRRERSRRPAKPRKRR